MSAGDQGWMEGENLCSHTFPQWSRGFVVFRVRLNLNSDVDTSILVFSVKLLMADGYVVQIFKTIKY